MHRSTSRARRVLLAASCLGSIACSLRAATLYGLTESGAFLVRFESSTPSTIDDAVFITGLQASERIVDIDFRPRTGQLYGIGVVKGATDTIRVYTIDPRSGAATLIPGSTPFTVTSGNDYGMSFNPTVDRIRVVNDADENFRINPNNGTRADSPTNDTDLNPAGAQVCAVAYDRSFDSGFAIANRTTAYAISRATSSLVTIGGINQTPSPNGGAVLNSLLLGNTLAGGADVGFEVTVAGQAFASLTRAATGDNGLFTVNLGIGAASLIGSIGNGSLAIGGLAAVPPSIFVVGADQKTAPDVRVVDSNTGLELMSFSAFAPDREFGVRVAAGDLTLDGVPDIVCGSGKGDQEVRAFDGASGAALANFTALDPFEAGFTGGVFVAAGDVDGDGNKDVIVGRGSGKPCNVRVFSGANGSQLLDFTPFDADYKKGVLVAAADFDRDGDAEVIVAPAKGAPTVRVFDATGALFTSGSLPDFKNDFRAFPAKQKTGVFVAAGDVNGDGVADIVVGAGKGSKPEVAAFSGVDGGEILRFRAFKKSDKLGVRVAVADVDVDGRYDIVATTGSGKKTEVIAFDGVTGEEKATFPAFETSFKKGAFVAGVRR